MPIKIVFVRACPSPEITLMLSRRTTGIRILPRARGKSIGENGKMSILVLPLYRGVIRSRGEPCSGLVDQRDKMDLMISAIL